jgi:hypothetical protein
MFIEHLDGISSTVVSDHILNLFVEIEGRLPDAKPAMLEVMDRFLALPAEDQCRFKVGRRLGIINSLDDLNGPRRRARVDQFCAQHGIGPQNVDALVDEMIKRFI